jgi:hypothetical protein
MSADPTAVSQKRAHSRSPAVDADKKEDASWHSSSVIASLHSLEREKGFEPTNSTLAIQEDPVSPRYSPTQVLEIPHVGVTRAFQPLRPSGESSGVGNGVGGVEDVVCNYHSFGFEPERVDAAGSTQGSQSSSLDRL